MFDAKFFEIPVYRIRQMEHLLRTLGYTVGRRRVTRFMCKNGLVALYQKPRASGAQPTHKKYTYLLKSMEIDRPNQLWFAGITYIPLSRGLPYLVASMQGHSRVVIAWRLSNAMDCDFCVAALEYAIGRMMWGRSSVLTKILNLTVLNSPMH